MTFPNITLFNILAHFPLSFPKVFPQITVVSDAMAMPSPWYTAVLDLHNAATLELQLGQLAHDAHGKAHGNWVGHAVVMTMARWLELTNKQ